MLEADALEGWSFVPPAGAQLVPEQPAAPRAAAVEEELGGEGVECLLDRLPLAEGSLTKRLETCGFAVFDHAAGAVFADACRGEVLALYRKGLLGPSRNKLATAKGEGGVVTAGHELPKRGVFELDLVVNGEVREPAALRQCPAIEQLLRIEGPGLAARISAAYPRLQLTGIDTIKLQARACAAWRSLLR